MMGRTKRNGRLATPLSRPSSRTNAVHLLSAAAGLSLFAAPAFAVVLPAGTTLSVRLTAPLSSRHAKPGDPVDAVLIAPVGLGEADEVRPGASVRGRVVEVCGHHGRAGLLVRFDRLAVGGGAESPIDARVSEVDNAREAVGADGRIVGLPGPASPPSRLHALLLLAAYEHPVALAVFEASRLMTRALEHVGIHYAPGVEMTLVTEGPAEVTAEARDDIPPLPDPVAAGSLADSAPLFAVPGRKERREDLTNVVVVGSEGELSRAFVGAGWTRAETSRRATTRAFLALAEHHGYKSAPVSLLELQGRPPDVVFEKQNNSMAKRHHIRLWRLSEGWNGRPAWLGAATHDVGIVFDRPERTFTHQVDPEIDRERDKIVDDLAFTGDVGAISFVPRPRAPRSFESGGATIVTDGRLAVVALKPIDGGPRSIADAVPSVH
jgi:hypothetical protein